MQVKKTETKITIESHLMFCDLYKHPEPKRSAKQETESMDFLKKFFCIYCLVQF